MPELSHLLQYDILIEISLSKLQTNLSLETEKIKTNNFLIYFNVGLLKLKTL